jgi:hypothetical protein
MDRLESQGLFYRLLGCRVQGHLVLVRALAREGLVVEINGVRVVLGTAFQRGVALELEILGLDLV